MCCVIFVTLSFNCVDVKRCLLDYIFFTYKVIATSSSLCKKLALPFFHDYVSPYMWFHNDMKNMPNIWHVTWIVDPTSTTSIIATNIWLWQFQFFFMVFLCLSNWDHGPWMVGVVLIPMLDQDAPWVARTFAILKILNMFYDYKEANTLHGCALSTCSWSNILVAFVVTMDGTLRNHLDFLKLSALVVSSHWSNRLGGLIVVGLVLLGCLAFKSQCNITKWFHILLVDW
jgi:hypothetical protein